MTYYTQQHQHPTHNYNFNANALKSKGLTDIESNTIMICTKLVAHFQSEDIKKQISAHISFIRWIKTQISSLTPSQLNNYTDFQSLIEGSQEIAILYHQIQFLNKQIKKAQDIDTRYKKQGIDLFNMIANPIAPARIKMVMINTQYDELEAEYKHLNSFLNNNIGKFSFNKDGVISDPMLSAIRAMEQINEQTAINKIKANN